MNCKVRFLKFLVILTHGCVLKELLISSVDRCKQIEKIYIKCVSQTNIDILHNRNDITTSDVYIYVLLSLSNRKYNNNLQLQERTEESSHSEEREYLN
jgi:hypothetical protein